MIIYIYIYILYIYIYDINNPFAQDLALQSGTGDCSPAPDLVL